MRQVSTSEALMTDPTTPEGAAYWQERHDYEEAVMDQLTAEQYREALRLVLLELDSFNHETLASPGGWERFGKLRAHLATLAGQSPYGTPPVYGLRALRELEEVTPNETT
jgi:hypothetical protein